MTQIEILEELKKRTSEERLAVAEAALHLVREDLSRADQPFKQEKNQPANGEGGAGVVTRLADRPRAHSFYSLGQ